MVQMNPKLKDADGPKKAAAKSPKRTRKLFSIVLRKTNSDQSLAADFYEPAPVRRYLAEHKVWVKYWNTKFRIALNGKTSTLHFPGDNWFSSLSSAVEHVGKQIPRSEEQDWLTDSELPSWMIFPKRVPISWGFPQYKVVADLTDKEEAKFVAKIDRRRRAYEKQNLSGSSRK
jgi:hypothetical protein